MSISSCKPSMDMSDTENPTVGCFSSIRKQVFCACNLPTESSDCEKQVCMVESNDGKELNTEKMKGSMPPGIVARLMGLESMPEPNFVPRARNPDGVVRRSRSVSSIDHWSGFDPSWHRRVMTSVSFQNMPTLLEIDNSEFLLVSAENDCVKGIRSKERKTEMGSNREVKQRGTDRSQNKLKRRDVVVVKKEKKEKQVCSKIVSHQKDSKGKLVTTMPAQNAAASRKIKHICSVPTQKKKECVCISRDQMPLEQANRTRFLNRENFIKKDKGRSSHCRMEIIKPKPHLPAKENSRQRTSSRTRKQPVDILEFTNSSIDSTKIWNSMNQQEAKSSRNCTKSTTYFKVRGDVCKLEEEDIECRGRNMWKLEHMEAVGIEFGLLIFDRLIHEVVAELSGVPLQNLGILLVEDNNFVSRY